MTISEKGKIFRLKKQVEKVLRLTLPLPLDSSIPIEDEILREQSPTYAESTDDSLLSDYSNEYKEKMYRQFENMVKDTLNL